TCPAGAGCSPPPRRDTSRKRRGPGFSRALPSSSSCWDSICLATRCATCSSPGCGERASARGSRGEIEMAARREYDYVIVGAGSAGCVLAYRLTADPSIRVLVLEAGGRDTHPLIHVPIGLGKIWEHRMFDWGYDTEPEPRLDNRRIEAMRGKVLGGSSSINVMAYVRGHPRDYDRWATNGCPGWSYADVLPYFKRCETWEKGEDTWRGGGGPLHVIDSRNRDPLFDGWLAAAQEADWPFTEDYNGRDPEGFGLSQWTI